MSVVLVGWEKCQNGECTDEIMRMLDMVKKGYSDNVICVAVPHVWS